MAIKKSVRLVDDTIKTLNELTVTGETNYSGSINDMSARYCLLVDDSMPELTKNELAAFYCAFNGYLPHPDIGQEIQLLHWHISEGYQHDEQIRDFIGSEEKAIAFIERIKNWSVSEKLAVIHKVRAYWRK